MDKIHKNRIRKWVSALRSGNFRQTTGRLHDARSDTFCCLGVACEISDLGVWRDPQRDGRKWGYSIGKKESIGGLMPSKVADWLGIPVDNRTSPDGIGTDILAGGKRLATLNDRPTSFSKIADLIEEEFLA